MKKSTEQLMAKLKDKGLSANTTRLHVNGRYTAIWYVDDKGERSEGGGGGGGRPAVPAGDDDDRRLELTDSLYTDKVVLTAYDGLPLPSLRETQGSEPVPAWWPATVVVMSDADEIVAWLARMLADLAGRRSPRGR